MVQCDKYGNAQYTHQQRIGIGMKLTSGRVAEGEEAGGIEELIGE